MSSEGSRGGQCDVLPPDALCTVEGDCEDVFLVLRDLISIHTYRA